MISRPESSPNNPHVEYLRDRALQEHQAIFGGELLAEDYANDQVARILDLEHRADHDPLTGLLNYRAFHEGLLNSFRILGRGSYPQSEVIACLLAYDVDKLRISNRDYGHIGANKIIQVYAQVLSQHTDGLGLVGRVGGDEFMSLVVSELFPALILADRIRNAVTPRVREELQDNSFSRSVSVGVRPLTTTEIRAVVNIPNVIQLTSLADTALYKAKTTQRGSIAYRTGGRYRIIRPGQTP